MQPPYPWLDLNSPALALLRESFYPHHQHHHHYSILSSLTKESSPAPPSSTQSQLPPPIDPVTQPSPSPRQYALSTFQSWSFKDRFCSGLAHPTIPHFITATAGLIEAQLHDRGLILPLQDDVSVGRRGTGVRYEIDAKLDRDRQRHISDMALCSIYAMAFGRFVTGFVDRDVGRREREQEGKGDSSAKRKRAVQNGREGKRVSDKRDLSKRRKTAVGAEGTLSQYQVSGQNETTSEPSDSPTDDDSDTSSQSSSLSTSDAPSHPDPGPQSTRRAHHRPQSMYTSALLLNLPRSFVDLRHRSTHAFSHSQSPPTLPEWRRATAEALDWIYGEFWERDVTGDAGVEKRRLELRRRECEEVRIRRGGGGGGGGAGVRREGNEAPSEHQATLDKEQRMSIDEGENISMGRDNKENPHTEDHLVPRTTLQVDTASIRDHTE